MVTYNYYSYDLYNKKLSESKLVGKVLNDKTIWRIKAKHNFITQNRIFVTKRNNLESKFRMKR